MTNRYSPPLYVGDPGYLEPVGDENEEGVCDIPSLDTIGFRCTRLWSHTGDHAAHGENDQQFASWPADKDRD